MLVKGATANSSVGILAVIMSFAFSFTVTVSVPMFGSLLNSGPKTCGHISETNYPQTTSNILRDLILRLGLNLSDAGTICLQFDKNVPLSNNVYVI